METLQDTFGDLASFSLANELINNTNNDSLYCFYTNNFTLVPYFVKQKNLYQNKVLIYDDEKTDWGTTKNPSFEEFDTRFVFKYEDEYGKEKNTCNFRSSTF